MRRVDRDAGEQNTAAGAQPHRRVLEHEPAPSSRTTQVGGSDPLELTTRVVSSGPAISAAPHGAARRRVRG